MRIRARNFICLLAFSVAGVACGGTGGGKGGGKGDAAAATKAAADSAAMANVPSMAGMPGMAMSGASGDSIGAIALTVAQIAKGKIAWEPAKAGSVAVSAVLPGQLVPNEDQTARLGAPVGGRVVSVLVKPGDRVTRGQVLVTLNSPEAAMAQSEAASADAALGAQRAQATYAKAAHDRAERLLALKAIPRQDYERAVADDELARSALVHAEAEAKRAHSTAEQLGVVGSASGEVRVVSPLAGVLLARTAVPGTVVEAGSALAVVTDASSLWLQVQAPEQLASLFARGAQLRFTLSAFAAETLSAPIEAVGAALDAESRTLGVRARVANASGRLKPEMLASVMVQGAQRSNGVVVPDDAVQQLNGKSVVFAVTPDGKGGALLTARAVTVGARSGGRIAVTSGLKAGDVIVTRGAFTVKAAVQTGSMPAMEM